MDRTAGSVPQEKRGIVMMKTKTVLPVEMAKQHLSKLQQCYELLYRIMPPYFFKTFHEVDIQDILPLFFDLERKNGIQILEREDSRIMVYLKDERQNPVLTSREMADPRILRSVVYESAPLPESGRRVIVEQVTYDPADPQISIPPLYSDVELKKEYRRLFGSAPEQFDDLYERINWREVEDLDISRIAARINLILQVQDQEHSLVHVEKLGRKDYRLSLACSTVAFRRKEYYPRILTLLQASGFEVSRSYLREFTRDGEPGDFSSKAVRINTFYITPVSRGADSAAAMEKLEWELNELCWSPDFDLFEQEFVENQGFCGTSANLLRAISEFVHSQLSFVDRNAYTMKDICRFMALYPRILRKIIIAFEKKIDPKAPESPEKTEAVFQRVEREIREVNTGMQEKDERIRMVLLAATDFLRNVLKCNYFSKGKSGLAFRLDPVFMHFYEIRSENYRNAFPPERPFGVFFFYRRNVTGFHVRFSEIARGGWRTVVPRPAKNLLEDTDNYDFASCELFREAYVLAHTQHRKNKDIYEGGSKLVTLLQLTPGNDFHAELWSAQRAVFDAFLSLINYDAKGRLRNPAIVDHTGFKEIIEIGPDENMFDEMICWMGKRAAEAGYTLGAGIISGKPEGGINHKHYGVTSFGVHQYLLRTLRHLKIDPSRDAFSVVLSGGPNGDVAGNEIKLLNAKDASGNYLIPNLKVIAVTDGPAAVYDPDGLDRAELSRLVHTADLDSFDPSKLRGEGAAMLFSRPVIGEHEVETYRAVVFRHGALHEHKLGRDDFMRSFQSNICRRADVFIPCGGRPSTLNAANWEMFAPDKVPCARAIVEGANSFLTPDARIELQKLGTVIVRDASANKCGVITSSYEILSGLLLSGEEFKKEKEELVPEVMNILRVAACREADWLFEEFERTGTFMTVLSDELATRINHINEEIFQFLGTHPEMISDKVIFDHLPPLFAARYGDRLSRIPNQYRRAIVSVELALRIVFRKTGSLENEIRMVM